MCGIGGIIKFSSQPIEQDELTTMHQTMQERGPDAFGTFIGNRVGFCHRRLAIIDLNPSSNQPFSILDGEIWISFNGEIYNFLELRKLLEKEGAIFNTHSDTEVICWGYKIWGIQKMLQHIDGMFAFAIFDKIKNKVFFARDRFGKKPFYVLQSNDEIVFASEIRAIWAIRKKALNLDFESLEYYFSEISSPQPKTIWKEICQIEPATFWEIDLNTNKVLLKEKYWTLQPSKNWSHSIEETVEMVENQLINAITKRTISDVPIGCFLSGGVDSGLVVSLLAQHSTERIKTFSIGLSYQKYNELPEAKLVAQRYDTDHHEIILESDIIHTLPDLVEYYGEPFADSSMIPTYYCSKALRGNVTVALSGDGGDELFGGYDDYGIAYRTDKYLQKYPNPSVRKMATLMDKLAFRFSNNRKENLGSLETYHNTNDFLKLYREIGIHPNQLDLLFNKDFKNERNNFTENYLSGIWKNNKSEDYTTTLFAASLNTRLLNDYLVKVDRASMKNSLEVRSPLLDYKLAELAFNIPNDFKFKDNHNKYLLKKLAEKHFNPSIFSQTKRGFGIPVHQWLRTDLKKYTEAHIFGGNLNKYGWFNMDYIKKVWFEHLQNKPGIDHTHTIWALLCFEIWLEKFYSK